MEVERLQREYPVTVRWAPYLLDPTIPPEGRERTPSPRYNEMRSHLEERAETGGLVFKPNRTFTPNSYLALETAAFAIERGHHSDALHRSIFKAHFEDSENIGDIDVLVRIAGEHGLDTAELRDSLEARAHREQVDEQIEWARSVGVTGIPTFIFDDRFAMVGAQEYPAFQRVMQELGHPPRGDDAAAGTA